MKITQLYRIEDGVLAGTEIEPFMAMLCVKYPHRKSKDVYIPPTKTPDKEGTTFHCCQPNCKAPDFEGTMDALGKHLELHAGRLFKKLPPVTKARPATVVVTLPANPWDENDNRGCNPDRRLAVNLYMDTVTHSLTKQGVGVIVAPKDGE